mmetsp:Transcript_7480/g.21766  ORF Transcript_7480/g.21766 Transcript_7480/m.21766 type:complete len:206 (+) Transcript_7480:197-814(+)
MGALPRRPLEVAPARNATRETGELCAKRKRQDAPTRHRPRRARPRRRGSRAGRPHARPHSLPADGDGQRRGRVLLPAAHLPAWHDDVVGAVHERWPHQHPRARRMDGAPERALGARQHERRLLVHTGPAWRLPAVRGVGDVPRQPKHRTGDALLPPSALGHALIHAFIDAVGGALGHADGGSVGCAFRDAVGCALGHADRDPVSG